MVPERWLRTFLGACLVALLGCRTDPERLPDATTPIPAHVPGGWPYPVEAPVAVADHGMVVTDAPLATRVGVEILREGGNAVDAAVATAFALAVVLPAAGNLGGGGFMVLHVNGESYALDFREAAPAAAHRDMFLDEGGAPTGDSLTGHRAAGVPGSVAGLWEAHRRFGSQPWRTLVEPAIRLAQEGFEVDADFSGAVKAEARRLARFEGSAALFLPGGEPIAPGARFSSPDLARSLRRIAEHGPAGFYAGETADRIVEEMRRGGGLVTHEDLQGYRARWREPIEFIYRGQRVISMPPPSSGGITLALIAGELESHDLAALGRYSPGAIHLQTEATRRAFAVRNQVLGDPDFVEMPLERILSRDFAASLAASISARGATPSSQVSAGLGTQDEGRHTTHFSVADRDGGVVALTTTLNDSYGSAVTVQGAGFLLNDEMDDFTVKPGTPNLFGLVQGEANAIAPGKRMLSSMTPTIVLGERDEPLLVTGASGGPHIITATFQILSNRLDHGLDLGASMSSPRFHHQHLPDRLELEQDGFRAELVRALQALGHEIRWYAPADGSLSATIERRDGRWWGASDPRTGGLALGY